MRIEKESFNENEQELITEYQKIHLELDSLYKEIDRLQDRAKTLIENLQEIRNIEKNLKTNG